jgi:hypothetical protein
VSLRLRGQRGSATLLVVVVFPVLLFFIAAAVQWAMWSHYRQIAAAAAQDAATQFAQSGVPGDADAVVRQLLADYGGDDLRLDAQPVVSADAEAVTVRLEASAPSLAGVRLQFDVSSTVGVEGFRP